MRTSAHRPWYKRHISAHSPVVFCSYQQVLLVHNPSRSLHSFMQQTQNRTSLRSASVDRWSIAHAKLLCHGILVTSLYVTQKKRARHHHAVHRSMRLLWSKWRKRREEGRRLRGDVLAAAFYVPCAGSYATLYVREPRSRMRVRILHASSTHIFAVHSAVVSVLFQPCSSGEDRDKYPRPGPAGSRQDHSTVSRGRRTNYAWWRACTNHGSVCAWDVKMLNAVVHS